MIPSGTFIRVVSGFYFEGKAVKARTYAPMTSIPVPGQKGNIIPLEVVPATDGSGTYVLVVSLQNPEIDIGTVDVALTYNDPPPLLTPSQTTGFQSDRYGNLNVNINQPLPIGSNTIGAVNVASQLPAGSNPIGGTYQAPTSSSSFALTPGSSSQWETSHILKTSAGNLYELYAVAGSVGGFLMTFDLEVVPPDGPVTPIECVPVAANSFVTIKSGGSPPDHYSNGIVAVFSATGPFEKTTTGIYGAGLYGAGPYGDNPIPAFFKWSVQ
jgi:hypothetical protein